MPYIAYAYAAIQTANWTNVPVQHYNSNYAELNSNGTITLKKAGNITFDLFIGHRSDLSFNMRILKNGTSITQYTSGCAYKTYTDSFNIGDIIEFQTSGRSNWGNVMFAFAYFSE